MYPHEGGKKQLRGKHKIRRPYFVYPLYLLLPPPPPGWGGKQNKAAYVCFTPLYFFKPPRALGNKQEALGVSFKIYLYTAGPMVLRSFALLNLVLFGLC